MDILCKSCGYILASVCGNTIVVAGQVLPAAAFASVTLKCGACHCTRDWYFERPPTTNGYKNGKKPISSVKTT